MSRYACGTGRYGQFLFGDISSNSNKGDACRGVNFGLITDASYLPVTGNKLPEGIKFNLMVDCAGGCFAFPAMDEPGWFKNGAAVWTTTDTLLVCNNAEDDWLEIGTAGAPAIYDLDDVCDIGAITDQSIQVDGIRTGITLNDIAHGLNFGDGDTGIYESSDDTLVFKVGGCQMALLTQVVFQLFDTNGDKQVHIDLASGDIYTNGQIYTDGIRMP